MCEAAERDLYAVLGASPSDSVQQLRHKYQQLALQFHPDRLTGACPTEAESAVKKFLEVDAAWRILSDQSTRRQYDFQRRAQELKQDGPMDSTVFLEDMTWHQDECVYSYTCRCGGQFDVSVEEVEEVEEQTNHQQHDDGEKHSGLVVCCDTCSLSVYVTWSSQPKAHLVKSQE